MVQTRSQKAEYDRIHSLSNRVFSNDLLREHIMMFAIADGDDDCSYTQIKKCRQINSTWLRSVNRCLRKMRKPLFSVEFSPRFGLVQFNDMIGSLVCPQDGMPPMAVGISDEFVHIKTVQAVVGLIARLGNDLISLSVEVPNRGSLVPLENTRVELSRLQSLVVKMDRPAEGGQFFKADGTALEGNFNTTTFLQKILSGCKDLKQFSLVGGTGEDECLLLGYENVRMPYTLESLMLDRDLKMRHVMSFMGVRFPHLTMLQLPFNSDTVRDNLVFRILNRVAGTLKHLVLQGTEYKYVDWREHPGSIQLPQMQFLETLEIIACNIRKAQRRSLFKMEQQLPALRNVKFFNQNIAMYRAFCTDSRYESVDSVAIHLHKVFCNEDDDEIINFFLAPVDVIFPTFPNIRELDLTFDISCGVTSLLFLVFQDAQQLQILGISILNGLGIAINSDLWLALFLGLPREWRQEPLENYGRSSIRNLSELKKLNLANFSFIPGLSNERSILPFDDVIEHGLILMPNLQHLCLIGDFEVSPRVINAWKGSGRVLEM